MSLKIQHPLIGEITGVKGDEVVQFLGVKYASVANRFAASKVTEYESKDGVVDATKIGPYVLSAIQGLDAEYGFIQHTLPKPNLTMSETDGLNLNITVPTGDSGESLIETSRKLPVFVFVHGGGYAFGSNTWPHYDQARFIKLSKDLGMPIIGVGIGYRLGVPGFLTSEELRQAGYPSNNGLRDQVNALRWVQRYIAGFGGNPENVTFGGESAGAVAGTLHLQSPQPLFKRLLSMSGTSLLLPPLPPPVSEFAYSAVLQALNLQNLSAEERVNALLKAPAEDLLTKVSVLPLLPVVDGDIITGSVSYSQISSNADVPDLPIPGRKWCTDLLIGDCQFDGSIGAMLPNTDNIAPRFITSLKNSLSTHPKTAETLLQSYNISPSIPNEEALKNVLQFATDISFFAAAIAFARGWPGTAHLYYFNEPNPWDGPWKGEATHILDVAYLFLNFLEFLEPEQKEVATRFAEDVVRFVNGKSTWKAFEEGVGSVRVYGRKGEGIQRGSSVNGAYFDAEGVFSEATGRSKVIFDLAEGVGLDTLSVAWGNFLVGK